MSQLAGGRLHSLENSRKYNVAPACTETDASLTVGVVGYCRSRLSPPWTQPSNETTSLTPTPSEPRKLGCRSNSPLRLTGSLLRNCPMAWAERSKDTLANIGTGPAINGHV